MSTDAKVKDAAIRVLAVWPDTGEDRNQLMFTGFQITEKQFLYPTPMQRSDLAFGIQVIHYRLSVELELHRVECKKLADIH